MTSAERQLPDQRREVYAANRDRFSEVYRTHFPSVLRFVAGRVRDRDRHAAEDLTQEAFLRVWPYLGKGEVHNEAALLTTVARHVLSERYTDDPKSARSVARLQHAREDSTGADWRFDAAQPPAAEPAVVAASGAGPSLLDEAVEALPPEIRQAVQLRAANGMSHDGVADVMGTTYGTAHRRTAAGLAALRAQLDGVSPAEAASTDPMVRARQAVAEAHRLVTEGRNRQLTGERARAPLAHCADLVAQAQGRAPREAAPARARATSAAAAHATTGGQLPTASELMGLAQVSHGTAVAALKDLRQQPTPPSQLHLRNATDEHTTRRTREMVQASGDSGGDPLARAREAVAEVHQLVAQGAGRREEAVARGAANETTRAQQLARWLAEDRASERIDATERAALAQGWAAS